MPVNSNMGMISSFVRKAQRAHELSSTEPNVSLGLTSMDTNSVFFHETTDASVNDFVIGHGRWGSSKRVGK